MRCCAAGLRAAGYDGVSRASSGTSHRMDASIDSMPASVWAIGQMPQTRDAILGTCSIVFPMASFSMPLTGVMEHQLPVSIMPASSTFRTSFECPSCRVVGEISTTFVKGITYSCVHFRLFLVLEKFRGFLLVRYLQCFLWYSSFIMRQSWPPPGVCLGTALQHCSSATTSQCRIPSDISLTCWSERSRMSVIILFRMV